MTSSKSRIIIAVIAVAITAAALGFIAFSNSPSQRFQKRLDLGQKHLTALEYEQAETVFLEALSIHPDNEEARNGLHLTYDNWTKDRISKRDYEKAVDVLNQAAGYFGDNQDINNQLTDVYIEWVDYLLTADDYDTALEVLNTGYERTHLETIESMITEIDKERTKKQAIQNVNDRNLLALANTIIGYANYELLNKPYIDWTYDDAEAIAIKHGCRKETQGHTSGRRINIDGNEWHITWLVCDEYDATTSDVVTLYDYSSKAEYHFKRWGKNEYCDFKLSDRLGGMTWRKLLQQYSLEGIIDYWDEVAFDSRKLNDVIEIRSSTRYDGKQNGFYVVLHENEKKIKSISADGYQGDYPDVVLTSILVNR